MVNTHPSSFTATISCRGSSHTPARVPVRRHLPAQPSITLEPPSEHCTAHSIEHVLKNHQNRPKDKHMAAWDKSAAKCLDNTGFQQGSSYF